MTDDSDPLKCPNCGTEYASHGYIVPRDDKAYYCLECALPPELIEDLEALADAWEQSLYEYNNERGESDYIHGRIDGLSTHLHQLRDIIAEYGDADE